MQPASAKGERGSAGQLRLPLFLGGLGGSVAFAATVGAVVAGCSASDFVGPVFGEYSLLDVSFHELARSHRRYIHFLRLRGGGVACGATTSACNVPVASLQEIKKNIPGYFSCVVAFQTVIYCVLYALGHTGGPRRRLAVRLVLAVCCLQTSWSVPLRATKHTCRDTRATTECSRVHALLDSGGFFSTPLPSLCAGISSLSCGPPR